MVQFKDLKDKKFLLIRTYKKIIAHIYLRKKTPSKLKFICKHEMLMYVIYTNVV